MLPFLPSRDFKVIIDPDLLPTFWTDTYLSSVIETISDLKELNNPVNFKLFTPSETRISASFDGVVEAYNVEHGRFIPSEWIKKNRLESFDKLKNLDQKTSSLLSLSLELKADCVVTSNKVLIDLRYLIYQHHSIRVIPLKEFHDFVEVCARGFSIYWSATSYTRALTPDIYYSFDHPNGKKLSDYFNSQSNKIENVDLRENLRNLSLNRYSFILLTRDLIKFYEIQNDFFTRVGQEGRFGTIVGYYVTNYYLYGWGLLDQLTSIFNAAQRLGVDERNCGIAKEDFWKKVKDQELLLFKKENKDWIQKMADIRHQAAHRTIMIPTALLVDTEESKKSDEDLKAELRKDRSYYYSMPYAEIFEKMEIDLLRIKKMRKLAPRMIFIKKEKGKSYFYDPVLSVDAELSIMNKFIDKFLEKSFKVAPNLIL